MKKQRDTSPKALLPESADATLIPGDMMRHFQITREKMFRDTVQTCWNVYEMLIESGMPKEDAELILPVCIVKE